MTESQSDSRKGCGCLFAIASVLCLLVSLIVILFFHFRIQAPVLAEETFEEGDTGWIVVGDAQGESDKPTYETEGGNPGAYMSAIDDAVGGVWFWSAPDSFLHQVTAAWAERGSLRAVLTFDLKQSDLSSPFEDKDVVLAAGQRRLHYRHAEPPGLDWTSYRVPLRPAAGWTNAETGEPATAEEMQEVVSALDTLWIRGEFRTGDDVGGIDNIRIR